MKKSCFLITVLLGATFAAFNSYSHRNHRELLIVACARSGTQYIAKSLREQGFKVGHERMCRKGICSWDLAAAPDAGRWSVRRKNYQFHHVFHQVRHPLKVISSVYTTEDNSSWNYILSQTPEINPDDPHLVKCAKYWYYWNLKAEKLAEWTYRIEEIDNHWEEFGKRLGRTFDTAAIASVPKNLHTKGTPGQDFTWEDLERELEPELFSGLLSLARKYGYDVPDLYSFHLSGTQGLI